MTGLIFLLIFIAATAGFFINRRAALALRRGNRQLHSTPGYHGVFSVILIAVPALLLLLLWLALKDNVLSSIALQGLPASVLDGASRADLSLLRSQLQQVAAGRLFNAPSAEMLAAAKTLSSLRGLANIVLVLTVLATISAGFIFALRSVRAETRARQRVEKFLSVVMIAAASLAILVTIGIFSSLIVESWRFFEKVPLSEFLFGLRWEPQIAMRADQVAGQGAFGWLPVFLGTLVITLIAMLIAVPVGILSAIYLFEFASPRLRDVAKPLLEILAGVPTVVYGFFAVLTVAPFLRHMGAILGLDVSPNTALAAGGVMGIMLIPFISSFTDDALAAVPQSLRDGSLALGATRAETVMKVLFPAAIPGIAGGVLLAVSRAIGETMIVVMAAGLIAKMTVNPLHSVTTVTVQIVTLLIGDSEFDNPKTLAAFALGLMLFCVTLILNVIALRIVRKYREVYE